MIRALSEGIKVPAKPVYVTLKSLLSVHSVPGERERERCACYQTAFVLSFVFLIFFETLRNKRKKTLAVEEGQVCSENVLLHK